MQADTAQMSISRTCKHGYWFMACVLIMKTSKTGWQTREGQPKVSTPSCHRNTVMVKEVMPRVTVSQKVSPLYRIRKMDIWSKLSNISHLVRGPPLFLMAHIGETFLRPSVVIINCLQALSYGSGGGS